MKLDIGAARRAIEERVARPLGISVIEAAWGIRKILDSKMADLLRRMTLERGYDPRDFTLFANGGAGPSHAWVLSAELGLDRFVVPATATAQSALGTGTSDLGFTTERPTYTRIQPGRSPNKAELDRINAGLEESLADVKANLALASADTAIRIERYVAIRFRGQTHHLDVPVDERTFDAAAFKQTTDAFEQQYETLFGHGASYSGAGYEILSVRVTGTGALPPPAMSTTGDELTLVTSRQVVFDDPKVRVDTTIYRTTFPKAGTRVTGPCIIEFPGQSVVVPPDAEAHADQFGNLHVRLKS
jgi:N-methylhydantoinase A